MAKKESVSIAPIEAGLPDFSSVLQKEDLSIADKRRIILEGVGLKGKKKKYESVEERKAASKARREERKAKRTEVLAKYGLEPKKKGPKLTKEQKKAKRSARAKERRGFMRDMARQDPDLAKKYGIDVKRFKLG